jgi:hypothetical protein
MIKQIDVNNVLSQNWIPTIRLDKVQNWKINSKLTKKITNDKKNSIKCHQVS